MEKEHAEDKFRRGREQFNARAFFDAHETWEEIWLSAPEPKKTFLQGIIQVAAAFHHYSRENSSGAHSLLTAGLAKLERFPADSYGLKLEELRASVRWWIAELAAGRNPDLARLPRLQPASEP